jgi:peptide/nickel transport system permease protein
MPSVLVFVPIMISLAMLTESALSFLSIGIQPPQASWGTIINDGLALLYTRPIVGIAPGLMIVLTAAALNLYGDSVRDALDPKTRGRGDA